MKRYTREELAKLRDETEVERAEVELPPEPKPEPLVKAKEKGDLQRASHKSVNVMTVLKGVTEAYTADEVRQLVYEAMGYARQWKSWEGMLAILKFQMEYSVGKPVQRSVTAALKPEDFARFLADDDNEQSIDNNETDVLS